MPAPLALTLYTVPALRLAGRSFPRRTMIPWSPLCSVRFSAVLLPSLSWVMRVASKLMSSVIWCLVLVAGYLAMKSLRLSACCVPCPGSGVGVGLGWVLDSLQRLPVSPERSAAVRGQRL